MVLVVVTAMVVVVVTATVVVMATATVVVLAEVAVAEVEVGTPIPVYVLEEQKKLIMLENTFEET